MYRLLFIILTALAVTLGLLVGTLNSDIVTLDLLWFRLNWPLGLIVLAAVAAGLLLGLLLIWLFGILPLRSRMRKSADQGGRSGGTGSLKNLHD